MSSFLFYSKGMRDLTGRYEWFCMLGFLSGSSSWHLGPESVATGITLCLYIGVIYVTSWLGFVLVLLIKCHHTHGISTYVKLMSHCSHSCWSLCNWETPCCLEQRWHVTTQTVQGEGGDAMSHINTSHLTHYSDQCSIHHTSNEARFVWNTLQCTRDDQTRLHPNGQCLLCMFAETR